MAILAILAALVGLGAVVGVAAGSTSAGGGDGGGQGADAAPSEPDRPLPDDDLFDGLLDPPPDPGAPPVSDEPDGIADPDVPEDAYVLDWVGLTPEEQLVVELVNRARLDPAGEVSRQDVGFTTGVDGSPKEALAVVNTLSQAARDHSADMDDRDFFAHTNPDGQTPADRALEAEHGSRFVGENIGWIGSSRTGFDAQSRIEAHHDNLWASAGHQKNLMNEYWSEIGTGVDYGSYRGLEGSSFVTENFGDRGDTYLTGVVIDDHDGDAFYDIGEGQGDVRVTAYRGDQVETTATWDSGGYSLKLGPGTYRVVFEGGDLSERYEETVSIGSENVKLDVIEGGQAADRGTLAWDPKLSGTARATLEAKLFGEEAVLTDLLPDRPVEDWDDAQWDEEEVEDLMGLF